MASSSRRQKSLSEKTKRATVMLGFGAARWTGTIIGQKFDKTLVLTVAHTLSSAPWLRTSAEIEAELSAYFYDDQQKKCACRIAFCRKDCDMLLLVVDKLSTADDKLIFALGEERNLKELQLLVCRGHPVGHPWRIETGEVCYPWIVNKEVHHVMPDDYDPDMIYFEHRLDLVRGYSGAALLNENGSIVGMQTGTSSQPYHVMGLKSFHDALKEKESESFKGELESVLISRYEQADVVSIDVPKSKIKFALHVNYLHDIIQKVLQDEGAGASTEESLDKALEDHFIK